MPQRSQGVASLALVLNAIICGMKETNGSLMELNVLPMLSKSIFSGYFLIGCML